jgi:hypothetical protein
MQADGTGRPTLGSKNLSGKGWGAMAPQSSDRAGDDKKKRQEKQEKNEEKKNGGQRWLPAVSIL